MHTTVIWFDGTLFWSASILQIFILVFFSLNITDVPVWCFYKCGWFISNWNAQIRPDEQYCCCRIERKSSYLLLKLIPKTSISWKLNFFKISNSSLKKNILSENLFQIWTVLSGAMWVYSILSHDKNEYTHMAPSFRVHIWNKFLDAIKNFRLKSNFQISKLDLKSN